MKLYRICGYGSGRSALVVRLVEEFVFRGLKVAVLKHAHKPFDMDKQGSDTWNLRQSGCGQTLIANKERWGLLCETPGGHEPDPVALARHLAPCDLVLAVGFDHAALPGLEVRRADNSDEPLYLRDQRIDAVVSDGEALPDMIAGFSHDGIEAIASHILGAAMPLSS
ncbi:MAG: molybdopterin-guanine dinucleotide biosynthesis protein B [Gammaproteobacteria bacterium]|nr:molybdopterin-guanine dinucleotide biosynthesis protein B [Gammaproteobacteria bacterium]MBU1776801.1 molybdopterin-guanine dinucleotide biosynthesis protein B [Gammaproteobacteria bacterium]MBU1969969.1 molybdopterin-guanine dinucleotide biosynthesis protein B [Gammaproteobacteria bacterium]